MAHSIRSAAVTIHLIVKATPHSHFALGNHGAPALRVTPEVSDDLHSAAVTVEADCENTPDDTKVLFAIEGVGEQTAAVQGGKTVPPAMIQQMNAALNKIKKEG